MKAIEAPRNPVPPPGVQAIGEGAEDSMAMSVDVPRQGATHIGVVDDPAADR